MHLSEYFKTKRLFDRAEAHSRNACRSSDTANSDLLVNACATYARVLLEVGKKDRAKAEIAHAARLLGDAAPTRATLAAHTYVAGVYNSLNMPELGFRHSRLTAEAGAGTALERTAQYKIVLLNYCGSATHFLSAEESTKICESTSEALDHPRFASLAAGLRINLAVSYFNAGRLKEAASAYESAKAGLEDARRFPPRTRAIVRANLGEVYEAMSKLPEAVAEYRDAFGRCDATWSTYYFAGTGLVRTLARTGEIDEAKALLSEMRAATPRTDTKARAQLQEAMGVIAEEEGSAKRAASAYARAVDLYDLAGATDEVARLCGEVEPSPKTCP
ncbi:MAG: tetratricopeptide repeat protein [Myxococcota bacterium]